jgi:hypothetical protein
MLLVDDKASRKQHGKARRVGLEPTPKNRVFYGRLMGNTRSEVD